MRRFFYHPWSKKDAPPRFYLIYVLSIIYIYHLTLIAYSNSTYMEQFVTAQVIGTLYALSSAIGVLAFLFMSRALRALGNVKAILWFSGIELAAVLLLGLTNSPSIAISAFVIFLIINPLIYFNIDVFSESLIGENESETGAKKGLTLALMSLAAAMGPFTLAVIAGPENALERTYLVAAGVFCFFIALVAIHFRTFKDPTYSEVRILDMLSEYWQHKNLRYVLFMQLLLQIFYSWTLIYIPLYMATSIGLGWEVIGAIIGIGVLAFAVFEYPLGILADKVYGEKEMLAIGFFILAVTVAWLSFMETTNFLPWAILTFITRIGASFVEAPAESYFFKHTKGGDVNTISFFRLTRPLGFLFGSLLGSAALLFLPFNLIFIVLGLVLALGLFFVIPITDTR